MFSYENARFSRICIPDWTAWIVSLPWGSCTLLTSLTLGMISHFPKNGAPQTFVSAQHLEGLLKLRLLEDLGELLIQQVWVRYF